MSETPSTSAPAETPKDGEVRSIGLYDKFHATMLEKALTLHNDKERARRVMASQTDRILTAETDEDIWAADMGGTVQASNAKRLEVRIYDYEPVLSNNPDITEGHGYYFSMNATCLGGPEEVLISNGLELGQDFVLQTGAELFTSKVAAFASRGSLPKDGVIFPVPNTKGMLKFYPLSRRVIPAETTE